MLLMNTCIGLLLKSTLGRRLGTGFIDLQISFWLLVDLFNSYQLHISYTKYVKLFFKFFDQAKSLSLFAW